MISFNKFLIPIVNFIFLDFKIYILVNFLLISKLFKGVPVVVLVKSIGFLSVNFLIWMNTHFDVPSQTLIIIILLFDAH